jgi:hypothetical protein
MVQKQNLSNDIFPCKDCVLIVQRKYTGNKMEVNDSMDTLLVYDGSEVIERKPIRKMSPGCRHCKGYFSYEMNLIPRKVLR